MSATSTPARSGRRGSVPVLVLVGVLLVALDLRTPLIAVAPVVDLVRDSLSVSSTVVSLLTGLPVLCFALASPLASLLAARAGLELAIAFGLVGVLAGTLLRSADGVDTAIAGTLLLGLSITIGNVAVPVLIGRDFPGTAPLVTAAYTAALNLGSMLASVATAPLAALLGWRLALASWSVLVLVAAAVWVPVVRRYRTWASDADLPAALVTTTGGPAAAPLWRDPAAIGLALAFGCQAFSYYGITAWLPTLLGNEIGLGRTAAGASSSIFQVLAIAGAFGVPAGLALLHRSWAVVLVVCAAWLALPVGLVAAPSAWVLWCVLGGAAQGGGITVLLSVIVERSRDLAENRRTSAFVQGWGYALGAAGPLVVGATHDATLGWTAPMLLVVAALTIMAAAGATAAARPRTAVAA